ncbi:MAG: YfaZ family protein [Gemmatimonadota bacterium]|nr:YfaZ family protein [Gemmatimonadota bacterium]
MLSTTLWRRSRVAFLALVGAGGLLAPDRLAAQDEYDPYVLYGDVPNRFEFTGGALFGSHSTTARLDSETLGVGTEIRFEDLLGFDSNTQNMRLDGQIRLGKRHRIKVGYISLSRNSSLVIDEEIQWGDETFVIDTELTSELNLSLVPVNWRFAVFRNQRVDVGLSLGFFTMFSKAGIASEGEGTEESSINLPLPVFGADLEWAIARKLILNGGVEYFGITISGITGSWSEFRGGIEYYFLRNLAVGAGYRSVNLKVDATGNLDDTDLDANLFFDYGFKGPQVYLTLSF